MSKRTIFKSFWMYAPVYLAAAFLSAETLSAAVVQVDLNLFTSDPSSAVSVQPDGFAAVLAEDLSVSPVSLWHSAFWVPADAEALMFDYDLSVPADNEDYFDFYAFDTGTPLFSIGGTGSIEYDGTYSFSLTPYRGSTIEMGFHLASGWDEVGRESSLTIRDVRVATADVQIPDGGATLLLLGSGIACLAGLFRSRI